MSIINSPPTRYLKQGFECLERTAARLTGPIPEKREAALIAGVLAAFAALWLLFNVVSLATLDLHPDLSEASGWAQHFAFGYKHPPLTAWIFSAWFAIFPRANWAAELLAVTTVTATLAITWRLLRDYLDLNRALVGIFSLMLVPLYTFLATKFNANLVMMPFWAAAVLFYLRAQRTRGISDAILAGAFTGLAFLGKYWAIYLVAGMAAASLVGPSRREFWRSAAPYAIAITAALVVSPHLLWLLNERSKNVDQFLLHNVFYASSFAANLAKSYRYLLGSTAYVSAPLFFFAVLWPGLAAIKDTLWPSDPARRQVLVLLAVPLLLPAFVNLLLPHRLTPLWTFPNWALLPIVLYASPLLRVPAWSSLSAALAALVVSVGAVLASPFIACRHLQDKNDMHRQHWQQIAASIDALSGHPVRLFWGSRGAVDGVAFYLPSAQRILPPLTDDDRAEMKKAGVIVICIPGDDECQSQRDALPNAGGWNDISFTRTFMGLSGPPMNYRVSIVPPASAGGKPSPAR